MSDEFNPPEGWNMVDGEYFDAPDCPDCRCKEARIAELEEWEIRAVRILRAYANGNPKHEYLGETQDPMGVHALLDKSYDLSALAQAKAKVVEAAVSARSKLAYFGPPGSPIESLRIAVDALQAAKERV